MGVFAGNALKKDVGDGVRTIEGNANGTIVIEDGNKEGDNDGSELGDGV